MWLRGGTMIGVLAALLVCPANAQDLPDPGAPEGAVATLRVDRPFDRYALPVGRFGEAVTPATPALRPVEGQVIWAGYRVEDPTASVASVLEGYRQRLAELGFTPLFECINIACGGFDFRFEVQLLPPPAMLLDLADFAQFTASRRDPGGEEGAESFASILISRALGAVHVQTVMVFPAAGAHSVAPAPPSPGADGAETTTGALVLSQDAATLLAQLTEHGHVTVQGLEFDTGGAGLSASSAAAIETTARMLRDHPELSILIVGHSDNQGGLEANISLSLRRADTVRSALIERGVEPGRLEAHGLGFLAPVTSNADAPGRALNRRVELVLR